MNSDADRKNYQVCRQCRQRKIRCDRDRPRCANCAKSSLECEWSGSGKKKNQTVLLSKAVSDQQSRLDHLGTVVSELESSLQDLRSEASRRASLSMSPSTGSPPQQQHPQQAQHLGPDFGVAPGMAYGSGCGVCSPSAGGVGSDGSSLPPQIAAAVQVLLAYMQPDADSRSTSLRNRNAGAPTDTALSGQKHYWQALQNLSTFHRDHGPLDLAAQGGGPSATAPFGGALHDSADSTPSSQQDDLALFGGSQPRDASQSFSPSSIPTMQQLMLYPGDTAFGGAPTVDELVARYRAYVAGMPDPSLSM